MSVTTKTNTINTQEENIMSNVKMPINNKCFTLNDKGQIIRRNPETKLWVSDSPFLIKNKEDNKYYRLSVDVTDFAESPREWCNICEMTCFLRNYKQPDNVKYNNAEDYLASLCHEYTDLNYDDIEYNLSWQDMYKALMESDKYFIMLIRYYSHSGMCISVDNDYPFNDRWDSGIYGFIGVSKEKVFKECSGLPILTEDGNYVYEEHLHENGSATYSVKNIPLTEENWEKAAERYCRSEVEVYNQYIEGDVYEFQLEELEPIYTCNKCGSMIYTDELLEIQNNKQYEIDGEIHHRCPYCEEELEVNIARYETIDIVDGCSGFYGDDINTNGISDEINLENYELIEENFKR